MKIGAKIFAAAIAVLFASGAWAANDEGFFAEHLRRINEARAAGYSDHSSAPPLAVSPTLCRAARIRAEELARSFSTDHKRPDGTMFYTVLTEISSHDFHIKNENIAAGMNDAKEVVRVLMLSDGDRSNIMRAEHNFVGLATFVVPDGEMSSSGHKRFWVELFSGSSPDTLHGGPAAKVGRAVYGGGQIWRRGSMADGITIVFDTVSTDLRKESPTDLSFVKIDGAPTDPVNFALVDSLPSAYSATATTAVRVNKILLDNTKPGLSHTIELVSSTDVGLTATFGVVGGEDYSSSLSPLRGRILKVSGVPSSELLTAVCDGETLAQGSQYRVDDSAADGSWQIELAKSYLDVLPAGGHILTLYFTGGTAETTFTTTGGGSDDPRGSSGGGCTVGAAALCLAPLALRRRRA